MSEHATSRGFYVALGIGLLVLTAITAKAAFINLGPSPSANRRAASTHS